LSLQPITSPYPVYKIFSLGLLLVSCYCLINYRRQPGVNIMNIESQELQRDELWQTKERGTNEQEYDIYRSCAESLGWDVKSYDEWLNS